MLLKINCYFFACPLGTAATLRRRPEKKKKSYGGESTAVDGVGRHRPCRVTLHKNTLSVRPTSPSFRKPIIARPGEIGGRATCTSGFHEKAPVHEVPPPFYRKGQYCFWRPRNQLRGPSADRSDGGADTFSGQPYHTRPGDAAHTVWQRRAGCRTRGGEWRQEDGGGWPVGRVGGGLRKTMITAAEPIARRTFRRTSSLRGPNENSGHLRERFICRPTFPRPHCRNGRGCFQVKYTVIRLETPVFKRSPPRWLH